MGTRLSLVAFLHRAIVCSVLRTLRSEANLAVHTAKTRVRVVVVHDRVANTRHNIAVDLFLADSGCRYFVVDLVDRIYHELGEVLGTAYLAIDIPMKTLGDLADVTLMGYLVSISTKGRKEDGPLLYYTEVLSRVSTRLCKPVSLATSYEVG